MKPRLALLIFVVALSLVGRSEANVTNAIINWLGNNGYRARISMTYEDSFAFVSAYGGGVLGGTATNQGISSLSVAFYQPLSLTPIYVTGNISGGVPTYKFLRITFDTTARTLVSGLDVGRDSFAEGDPGSSAGQYHLMGVSSPAFRDSFTGATLDSGGQFTTVPEPSTWALGAVGLTAFLTLARRSRLKRTP